MPVRERVALESKGALEGAASIVGMADRWGRINKFFDGRRQAYVPGACPISYLQTVTW